MAIITCAICSKRDDAATLIYCSRRVASVGYVNLCDPCKRAYTEFKEVSRPSMGGLKPQNAYRTMDDVLTVEGIARVRAAR
jgi:hypothetical protein